MNTLTWLPFYLYCYPVCFINVYLCKHFGFVFDHFHESEILFFTYQKT